MADVESLIERAVIQREDEEAPPMTPMPQPTPQNEFASRERSPLPFVTYLCDKRNVPEHSCCKIFNTGLGVATFLMMGIMVVWVICLHHKEIASTPREKTSPAPLPGCGPLCPGYHGNNISNKDATNYNHNSRGRRSPVEGLLGRWKREVTDGKNTKAKAKTYSSVQSQNTVAFSLDVNGTVTTSSSVIETVTSSSDVNETVTNSSSVIKTGTSSSGGNGTVTSDPDMDLTTVGLFSIFNFTYDLHGNDSNLHVTIGNGTGLGVPHRPDDGDDDDDDDDDGNHSALDLYPGLVPTILGVCLLAFVLLCLKILVSARPQHCTWDLSWLCSSGPCKEFQCNTDATFYGKGQGNDPDGPDNESTSMTLSRTHSFNISEEGDEGKRFYDARDTCVDDYKNK